MAATEAQQPNLNLTPDERRYFGQLFTQADSGRIGVVTGEDAVKFFEKTRLSPDTLGEIWQVADAENRGLLTPAGFGMVLRLIGYAQAGRPVTTALAMEPGGPLPKFDGIPLPAPVNAANAAGAVASPLRAQNSGAIRVPPLTADKVAQYSALFNQSGAQNGSLSGDVAKSIFERAQLSNETLGKIWTLSDTEQKGALGQTEFVIAMHLLASVKNGSMRAVPQTLPAGLYEAAARRDGPTQHPESRPTSGNAAAPSGNQFGGPSFAGPQRQFSGFQHPTSTGDQWLINPREKQEFDRIFATIDIQRRGFMTGDQAIGFFSNSRLPEDALAQIWDLADINSEGQLSQDEFAVAMYLIRQQRGKTTGRDVLPQQLPPNLIPPSMRRQAIAPQQPTAPTFDNAANISKPKAASEDLFGLDAFSAASPVSPAQSHARGSEQAPSLSTPSQSQSQIAPPSTAQSSSHFKSFVPTSTFGQTIMTPQGTGTTDSSPAATRSIPQPPVAQRQATGADDLLGDADPEVSKKLTSETSELGNLSNQVSTLSGQMQDVRNQRAITEGQHAQTQNQKRDFEGRLGQLRTAYEQEVKEVRALEERLQTSKSDTKKIQNDMALIQGTHQDLQNQHRQMKDAFASDQTENASLKERIRQISLEVEQLKPQVEKLRSDARHQKGLVVINKKQLAIQEAEREKLRSEADTARAEHLEATHEYEESQRDLDTFQSAPVHARATSSPAPAATVASPAPSTASMNPFFRPFSSNTPEANRGVAASPAQPSNLASPNHNAFDSFFGPTATMATAAPQTTFVNPDQGLQHDGMPQATSTRSSEEAGVITPPATAPSSNFSDSPITSAEPPAPPQSRQITSTFLPLRPRLEEGTSDTSSIQVMPPASRAGEPLEEISSLQGSERDIPDSPKQHFEELAQQSHQNKTLHDTSLPESLEHNIDPSNSQREVPGAFPGDETPFEKHESRMFQTPYNKAGLDPRVGAMNSTELPTHNVPSNNITATDAVSNGKIARSTGNKDHFDSAFSDFPAHDNADTQAADPFEPTEEGESVHQDAQTRATAGKPTSEFPPIREFGDDESESDEERGFGDDFTNRSSNKQAHIPPADTVVASIPAAATRPPFDSTNTNDSALPTPGAQASPPPYNAPGSTMHREGSNQFPAEYSGLLPARTDPTSASNSAQKGNINQSAGIDRGLNFFGESPEEAAANPKPSSSFAQERSPMAAGASNAAPFAFSRSNVSSEQNQTHEPFSSNTLFSSGPPHSNTSDQPPVNTAKDEFDFDDLAPAQEEETDGFASRGVDDSNLGRPHGPTEFDDSFDPSFDSPAPSQHTQAPSQSSNYFHSGQAGGSNNATHNTNGDSFAGFEPSASTGNQRAPGSNSIAPTNSFPMAGSAVAPASHDWDAIFAGLDPNASTNGFEARGPPTPKKDFPATFPSPLPQQKAEPMAAEAGVGTPAGANTENSPDDDPILKRLIGMGFSRGASLGALEKFDYNIDKAAEHLLSKS